MGFLSYLGFIFPHVLPIPFFYIEFMSISRHLVLPHPGHSVPVKTEGVVSHGRIIKIAGEGMRNFRNSSMVSCVSHCMLYLLSSTRLNYLHMCVSLLILSLPPSAPLPPFFPLFINTSLVYNHFNVFFSSADHFSLLWMWYSLPARSTATMLQNCRGYSISLPNLQHSMVTRRATHPQGHDHIIWKRLAC